MTATHPADAGARADRRIFLIQDAHVNYQAQQRLAEILQRLMAERELRLVLIEGGAGDASLSRLREIATPEARRRVAEQYLQSGMISGEEYVDLTSDRPLTLWGIDDPSRYDRHIDAFLHAEHTQEHLAPLFASLREAVDAVRQQGTTAAVQAFEARVAQFDAEQVTMDEHLAYLRELAQAHDVDLSAWPQVALLLRSAEVEASIDLDKVADEQPSRYAALRPKLSADESAELQRVTREARDHPDASAAFYRVFGRLLAAHDVDLSETPALAAYLESLRLQDQLDATALVGQIEGVHQALRARLSATAEESEVLQLGQWLDRCERLAQLAWSPQDLDAIAAEPDQIAPSRWIPRLQARAESLGVPWTWTGDATVLDQELAQAMRFYEAATVRDNELARRALAKMTEDDQREAVVIAGGFHAQRLAGQFAARGIDVVMIVPQVSEPTDDARYRQVLKAKYRLLRPERLMADSAPPAVASAVSSSPPVQ